MLNLDYVNEAFQIHLEYPNPVHLKKQLAGRGQELPIVVKPALQSPSANSLSDKLNHRTTWASMKKAMHPGSASTYLSHLGEMMDQHGGFPYFISFNQLCFNSHKLYQWYFCFTRLKPEENRLFLLYVSLAADDVWRRETDRFIKRETYRLEFADTFNNLTDREKEVLQWVAKGYSNPQTAEELGISRRTVESHRKNINRKLETSNLAELVRFALAFELV